MDRVCARDAYLRRWLVVSESFISEDSQDLICVMTMLPPKLQRTAAPLFSRTVQVIWQRLLQPTGRFRRRTLSSFGDRSVG
jgi:hypothetical protein